MDRVSLGTMVTRYRHETGKSPNANLGQNQRDQIVYLLQRTERDLFALHDWPFKRVERDKLVAAGQRYYDFPTDMDPERIEQAFYRWGTVWLPIDRGIDTELFSVFDSDAGNGSDPVQRWDIRDVSGAAQCEVWPIPLINGSATGDGRLRFKGIRTAGAFVADGDLPILDSDLIVLSAAAETLVGDKSEKATAVLQRFKDRWQALTGGLAPKKAFGLGSGASGPPAERRPQEIRVAYVR